MSTKRDKCGVSIFLQGRVAEELAVCTVRTTLMAFSIVAYDSARPTYLETINVLMMSLKSEL